jgi:DNA topoisomerase-1
MEKKLVIVESPAKAKTIKKYLGAGYEVLASYGHVRAIPRRSGMVKPENEFSIQYEIIQKNSKHIDAIVKAMKEADELLLAPDPDREGEAIAWNIGQILQDRKVLQDKKIQRVVFHEITKKAIQEAVTHPREISMDLVNAQQARQALDYLVGFNLSPLLWKKVRRGLSAGRVQSPALRLIVERELEIEAFITQEYWTIEAQLHKEQQDFTAKLIEYKGEKVEQFTIVTQDAAQTAQTTLEQLAQKQLQVSNVEKKQRKRNPSPAFTTSTLQQEAARKLGFTAQRTMRTAQQLYEGVEIGTGSVGLITYMRTDSVNLANEAINDIRELISKRYGNDNLPETPRFYKTKAKNAQEAHEAIRPTAAKRTPEEIKEYLSSDQFKLYDLIWKRTIACQMISATINTVAVDFICGNEQNRFRANGSTIADPGFIAVYSEGTDDHASHEEDKLLPPFTVGELVPLKQIKANQHFTEPPPRYSEASLIKTLEEYGIGRPSTYASIISTLQTREYALLENKRFHPTDVGRVVTKFLTEYFTQYVDYDFTMKLEDQLDEVSRGELQWIPLLKNFWTPFHQLIGKIDTSVQRSDVTQELLNEACPDCSKSLCVRLGKTGRFISCTGFPDCTYTRSLENDQDDDNSAEIIGDRKCPKDQAELVIKRGPYGKFIGCSNYPKCKFIEPLVKPRDTEVACPQCHKATILERKSKRGKIFFSCAAYPSCKYALWNEPLNESCPKCQWPILTKKITKRSGTEKICPKEGCTYKVSCEE